MNGTLLLAACIFILALSPARAANPDENAVRIAALLGNRGLGTSPVAQILSGSPALPVAQVAQVPPVAPVAPVAQVAPGTPRPAPGPAPAPARPAVPGARAVCLDAAIEDNPRYTLITLKFSGDPQLESRPWKASRRLMLTVLGAELPRYNQPFVSSGKLISEVELEQLPAAEVRLMMKVAAGTDVSVYKRRTPGAAGVEYAVLFEIPPDPVHGGGDGSLDWPVRGRLSSKYGWRLHPILHEHRMHSGIDIAVPEGTPIHAAQSGRVVYSASKGGAGLCVIIEHTGGRRSSYAHCSKLKVKEGDVVSQNQVLALAGSTGLSTGPHVHFSVTQNGEQIDPIKLLGSSPEPAPKSKKKKPEPKPDDDE